MAAVSIDDLNKAKQNTDFIEKFTNSENETEFDRLGRERTTLAGVEAYISEHGILSQALAAEAGAEAAQSGAQASATSAATSADIARALGRIYPTPAAGVNPAGTPSGVAPGEYFSVPSSTVGYALDLYRNSAGTPVLQNGKSILATDAALYYRGTTEAGEVVTNNFNLLIKPGWYWNARAAACSNTPYGTAVAPGAINVARIGPDLGRRTFYRDGLLAEQHVCTFTFSTGAIVSAWKRALGDGQIFASLFNQTSKYRGSFDSAATDPAWGLNYSSFNSATLPGFYWNPKSSAVLMSPYGTAVAQGGIVNEPMGPDLMLQTWYKAGANPQDEVWSRPCTPSLLPDPSAWGLWSKQHSLTAKITALQMADDYPRREVLTSRPVNTDRDCNKALLPGNYILAPGVAVLNTPAGAGASTAFPGTLNTAVLGDRTIQTLYVNDSLDTVWVKSFPTGSPGGTWLPRFNPYSGISLGIVGDSNGAGTPGAGSDGSYLVQLARLLGVSYTNYSVGGASMEDRPIVTPVTAPINAAAFCNVTAGGALAAHNLVLVVQGTNYGTATILGPLNSTDKTQFYGAMRVGYDNIRAGNPNARVVFGLPIYSNAAGNTVQARRDAIVAWCKSMNVPFIDFCGPAGINAATAAADMVDDIHMGPSGHFKTGRSGYGQLRVVMG